MTIFFTDSEAVMSLRAGSVIRLKLARSLPPNSVRGPKAARFDELLPWQRSGEVARHPNYAQVRYGGVLPGDLVYHGNQRQLEYDFVLAPGAKPDAVDPLTRRDSVDVAPDGSLLLKTAAGEW